MSIMTYDASDCSLPPLCMRESPYQSTFLYRSSISQPNHSYTENLGNLERVLVALTATHLLKSTSDSHAMLILRMALWS